MNTRVITVTLGVILIIMTGQFVQAQTVTRYSGEYATDRTEFEYEITASDDPTGLLKYYWGFNETGDTIRFELGRTVFSEDYEDVYYSSEY